MHSASNAPTFDREDIEGNVIERVSLPWSWAICATCNGHGKTSRAVECAGGGITASEMGEICHDEPEFLDDYMSGRYDRDCGNCNGLGKVKVIDKARLEPALRIQVEARAEADARHEAELWEERRMRERGYQF